LTRGAPVCVSASRSQSRERNTKKQEAYMIIGTFTEEGDGYTGSIRCLGLRLENVTFGVVLPKRGDGPDFMVFSQHHEDDGKLEIGVAWKRVSEEKGKAYLSVKLDAPTFPAPINCALTRQQDGSHALLWNRPKPKGGKSEQTAEPADEATS
jgi:uncharacterized protein (DUF736 family)